MRFSRSTVILLLLVLISAIGFAGCHSSSGSPAPTPDPFVHLHLTDQRLQPAAAIPVVVWDSAGAVADETASDASGAADVQVPPGGSFGVFGRGYAMNATRVFGAAAGSDVRLDYVVPGVDPSPTPTQPPYTTAALTFTVPAGTVQVRGTTDCSSGATSGTTLDLSAACDGVTHYDVWAVAFDANGLALAWGNALAQPANPGSTSPITIALSNTTFDAKSLQGSFHAGSGTVYLDAKVQLTGSYGEMEATNVSSVTLPAGSANVALRYLPTVSGTYTAMVSQYTNGSSWYFQRSSVVSTDLAFDFASPGAPVPSPVDATDHLHPRLSWTLPAPHGEALMASITWGRGGGPVTWQMIAPSDAPSFFSIPDVPAPLDAWATTASATSFAGDVRLRKDLPSVTYGEFLAGDLQYGSLWYDEVQTQLP